MAVIKESDGSNVDNLLAAGADPIYDQTIRSLSAKDRLRLARHILDELSPEESLEGSVMDRGGNILDQSGPEELLLSRLISGPGIEVTEEYWDDKRTALIERHAAKVANIEYCLQTA